MHRRVSTEVSDDVPAREKLPKTSVNRQQPFGRQDSLELLVGDHQLVTGIEILRQRSGVQRALGRVARAGERGFTWQASRLSDGRGPFSTSIHMREGNRMSGKTPHNGWTSRARGEGYNLRRN